MQLTEEEIAALADAVVDRMLERGVLADPEPQSRVMSADQVAKLLNRARPWVYEHAAELGAFRYGSGPKARIGFDLHAVQRWKAAQQINQPDPPPKPTGRRRPAPGGSDLITFDPQ